MLVSEPPVGTGPSFPSSDPVMTHLSKVQEHRVIHLAVIIYSKLSLVPDTGLSLGDLRKRGKRNLCRDPERGARVSGETREERGPCLKGRGCLLDPGSLLSVGLLGRTKIFIVFLAS